MKMNKKLGVAALALFMFAASYTPVNAQETGEVVNVTTHADGGSWDFTDGVWSYTLNGVKQTGWLDLGGTWYYLNASGEMVTGWLDLDGTWYYLDANGIMSTGWLDLGGTWYYLDANGIMSTGWLDLDGTWYYLDAYGMMSTGWLNMGGTWYYLDAAGRMLTNTVLGAWEIDENGIATEYISEEYDFKLSLERLEYLVSNIEFLGRADIANWDALNLDDLLAKGKIYIGENPINPNPSPSEVALIRTKLDQARTNVIFHELTQENFTRMEKALAFSEADYLLGTAAGVDPSDIFADINAWYEFENSYYFFLISVYEGYSITNSEVAYNAPILETPLARK